MADPRVLDAVSAAYSAFNRGDVQAVLDLMHPDVECHPPPTSVDPHPLQGREAVRFQAFVNRDEAMAALREPRTP
jgi:ketosteroid isomerase-like protein